MKDSLDFRYASALFMVAKEDDKVLPYQKEMKELNKLFSLNQEFISLLKNEFIVINKRYDVVDRVLKEYSSPIRNFIKVLMQNHRLSAYQSIFSSFNSLCNEDNGVIEGIVYSVSPLQEDKIHKIEDALAKKNNIKVELINRIDKSLIGGVKVVVNNHIYDYSIINELNLMRARIK